ncbi:MAG: tyrosine-type recombinase/integrase [Alicyclobacillus sp.]|nr:tyrosine-type recombinase/integrase [Alicyclobacillus sp.]
MDGFRASQIALGKSPKTVQTYVSTLQHFSKWLYETGGDLAQLTRHDVQSYITHLDKLGRKATTIEKVFAAISEFADYLEKPEVVLHIRRPEVRKARNVAPKCLERNERNQLLRLVERDGNRRNIAIVYVLLMTGLRVSELCALNRDDIAMSERKGQVTVRHGKGNVSRTVPLPSSARFHLSRYLEIRDDANPALFLSQQRRRITTRQVQHILRKYGVHPHILRHTYCRDLIRQGVDIATVAELAGHTDVNVTRRYARPSASEIEDAIERALG